MTGGGQDRLAQARAHHAALEWRDAFGAFAAADAETPLDAEDLLRWGESAFLSGRIEEFYAAYERAFAKLSDSDPECAVNTALFIAANRLAAGQQAAGAGWLAQARAISERLEDHSVQHAHLMLVGTFGLLARGRIDAAVAATVEAVSIARRFGDHEKVALALHQRGLILVGCGRPDEGLAVLDEALVELASPAVSHMARGIIYCNAIRACWTAYELGRADEWSSSMDRWCRGQPQLGNFAGECRVYRAEMLHLHGSWPDAAEQVREVVGRRDPAAAGAAAYLQGNLLRLQGEYDEAEAAFGEASRLGRSPQPGLALLRLARGSSAAAAAMVRRCLAEPTRPSERVELLAGAVEVFLAEGDDHAAREAASALEALAAQGTNPLLRAVAHQATGQVELAEGDVEAALGLLRPALAEWLAFPAPYAAARVRLLLAEACRRLGDEESARLELEAARAELAAVGAAPDLRLVEELLRPPGRPSLLTERETEVLRLLAGGATNRAIAQQLVLSERTVDRHVSNLYAKLGVSTRAAATAYAYENDLV